MRSRRDKPHHGHHQRNAHELVDAEDFAFLEYTQKNVNDYLERYFKTVYEMCKWGKFDILGHLTYPLRYIEGISKIKVNTDLYKEIIAESFKLLIAKGKGIEINTSGLRQPYGLTFPTSEYIMLYRSLGGEIISLGSDAHCSSDLGKGIAEGAEIAVEAGFKHICFFRKRKPVFIKISKE